MATFRTRSTNTYLNANSCARTVVGIIRSNATAARVDTMTRSVVMTTTTTTKTTTACTTTRKCVIEQAS